MSQSEVVYEKLTINARIALSLAKFFSGYKIDATILERIKPQKVKTDKVFYTQAGQDKNVDSTIMFVSCITNKLSLGAKLVRECGFDIENIVEYLPPVKEGSNVAISNNNTKVDLEGFGSEAISIIVNAYRLANRLQHIYVGTEHIILAILSDDKLLACKRLAKIGLTYDKYFDQLMGVANYSAMSRNFAVGIKRDSASQIGVDLVELARKGKLDPVIGREDEIDQLVNVLSRRRKNNAIVVGQAGVGKTALVEGLAQRIADGKVPSSLAYFKIVAVDITAIVAGSKMRGDIEEKIGQIVNMVIKSSNIILFIDEMQSIITNSSPITGSDLTAILKPALLIPEFRCLGTITTEDWNRYFEEDKALSRRFQPIFIDEPTVKESIEILKKTSIGLQKHHQIKINDEAIKDAVILSDRFISDRYLPDKAIDLLDEATATKRLEIENKYSAIIDLEKELAKSNNLKEQMVLKGDMDKAVEYKKKSEEILSKITQIKEKVKKDQSSEKSIVDSDSVKKIIAKWTGIPVGTISDEDSSTVLNLAKNLNRKIIGQKDAVKAVSNAIKRARANVSSVNRPWASLLFLGPTGVGKTELAKEVAKELFGDDKRLIQIDMSEMMEQHSVSKLIGSPPGYVGYKEGGQLTEQVARYPHSVVLFDEVEKAHPSVLNILLQIFEEGHLTDAKGKKINFKNTIIILTSNIGVEEIQTDKVLGFAGTTHKRSETEITDAYESMKSALLAELKEYLRPELFNRLDDVVIFRMLRKSDASKIVKKLLDELNERLAMQFVKIELDDNAIKYIVKKGFSEQYGARMLRRVLQDEVESVVADWVLRNGRRLIGAKTKGKVQIVSIFKDGDKLDIKLLN